MKNIIWLLFPLLLACQNNSLHNHNCGWQKVLVNDAAGEVLFGSKQKLVDAVRLGFPVRLGFGGQPIEHFAEANFLTIADGNIVKGEVFAQISTIVGQIPTMEQDSFKMRFRTSNHWTKMAGTNGYATAFMTDYHADTLVGGGNDRYRSTTWYVNFPCHPANIEPVALIR